jgi:hypothetical protein
MLEATVGNLSSTLNQFPNTDQPRRTASSKLTGMGLADGLEGILIRMKLMWLRHG